MCVQSYLAPFFRLVWALALWMLASLTHAQVPTPSNLSVVQPYDGQVNLVWTPNPTATAYAVSRELLDLTNTPTNTFPAGTNTPTPMPTNTPIAWVPSSAFSVPVGTPVLRDFQVTNGRSYLYQVSGLDPGGVLGLSAGVTGSPYGIPGSVSLSVLKLRANTLDLTWNPPLSTYPIAYYNIYAGYSNAAPTPTVMSASALVTANPTPIATAMTPVYSDQSLGVSTGFYAIVAVDDHGNPGPLAPLASSGASANASLPPAAPQLSGDIPATPTITPTYGVLLSWTGALGAEGVTQYQVRSNDTPIATIMLTQTPLATYTYLDTSIVSSSASGGRSTTYSVAAMSAQGSTDSNEVQQIIRRPFVTSPIKVTPDATQNAVTLTWNQGIPETYGLGGYRLYKSAYGTPPPFGTAGTQTPTPFATIVITPSSTPTLVAIDQPVTNAGGLTYWVQPYDLADRGGEPGFASTPVLVLAPTPVTTVLASGPVGNNRIALSWAGDSPGFYGNIDNYTLQRFSSAAPTLTPVATVAAPVTTFTDTVPYLAGMSVGYRVGAVDARGNTSAMSAASNLIPLSTLVPPPAPTVGTTSAGTNSLSFRWLFHPAADNVTSYSVFGPDWPTMTVTPTPIATVIPSPTMPPFVNNATTDWSAYTYYVGGTNAQGSGEPATLSAIAVPAYQVTAVMTPGSRQVDLSWNMTPGATPSVDELVIYKSPSYPAGSFAAVTTISPSTSSYVDAAVTPGIHYSYVVTARTLAAGTPVAESPVSMVFTPSPYGDVLTWPNKPSGVSVSGSVTQTTLSWVPNAAPETVLSYTLWRNGTATATITPSPTFSIPFDETPGVVSSYKVVASNANGDSDASASVSVLSVPSMTPVIGLTPPPGFTPTPGATPAYPQEVWITGLLYPGDVAGYTVYRSLNPAFPSPTVVATLTAPISFVSAAGVTGETNYYKLVANNGGSVSADFTISHTLGIDLWPNPPASVSLDASATAVTLRWPTPTGSSPVTAYDIYRSTTPGAEIAIATAIPQATVSYVDAAVTPGVPYYYAMDSQGSGLNSAMTSEQAIIPGPVPTLSAVSGTNQAVLTWSPVTVGGSSPVTGYAVYRMALPATVFSKIGPTIANLATTSYTDSSVSDSSVYVYKVAPVALTPAVSGGFSNAVTVTVLPQPPSQISAVTGNQVVQLRWDYQGTPLNTYSIQRKLGTAPVTAFETIRTGLTTLDFVDTGLLDKTFYTYQLLVVDPLGLTGTSRMITALPAKPPVVENGELTLVQAQSGNTISWNPANTPASDFDPLTMYPLGGYHIYRSTDGGGTYQMIGTTSASVTTYTDPVTVISGSNYTYLVRVFDAPPDVDITDPAMVHDSLYGTVTAYSLSASTALDRNSLRPYGAANEQLVHIRFVVTNPGNVNIKVYTLSGTFVKELVNQHFDIGVYGIGGNYPLSWDGKNSKGNLVASGVYLITTEMAGGHQEFQKIAVIK